jgi:P-type Cu+ transporter
MTCAACSNNIERQLKKMDGVIEVNVNLAAEKASITYDPSLTGTEHFRKKIEDLGYEAKTQPDAVETKLVLPVTGMTCASCANNIERTLNKKRRSKGSCR